MVARPSILPYLAVGVTLGLFAKTRRTKACTGRAYAVRRFREALGIQPLFVPPVMRVVCLETKGIPTNGQGPSTLAEDES